MLSNFKTTKTTKNKQQSKTGKHFWTFNNTVLCIAIFLVLPICTFTAFFSLFSSTNYSLFSLITSSNDSPHATSIPWIDNASECQYTNRSWHENKCWDDEHSHTF